RLSVLRQNHFDYEEERVIDVVIMGNEKLYNIMKEKDAIYMKADFSDEDGVRAAELESEFAELGGWEAESEASQLLQNLNISEDLHYQNMSELANGDKVRSEEHTSELQSRFDLVCRLLLEKKKE